MTRPAASRLRSWITMLGAVTTALLLAAAAAQDQFAFMPASGPELLVPVLDGCSSCDDIAALAARDLSAEEWRAYFEGEGALTELSEAEVLTLASYLSINLPNEAVRDADSLPRGGRSMTIMNCQLCHSIAIPMTQERSVERWLQHRLTPPHDSLRLSDEEWETLAYYLTLNAPLPLEEIPEQLRRGAGGY